MSWFSPKSPKEKYVNDCMTRPRTLRMGSATPSECEAEYGLYQASSSGGGRRVKYSRRHRKPVRKPKTKRHRVQKRGTRRRHASRRR